MDTRRRLPAILVPGLLCFSLLLVLPAVSLAHEPASSEDEGKIVIVQDDGDELVIDMEAVHEIVAETMEGLDEVMAELDDMQLQVRLGRDNRLDLSYDDTTFELDLDQIMTQVAAALEAGFEEFDTDDWTDSRNRWTNVSEDDLRQELDELQREIRELRRELQKIKDPD